MMMVLGSRDGGYAMGMNYCVWLMTDVDSIGSYVMEGSTNEGIWGFDGSIHAGYIG